MFDLERAIRSWKSGLAKSPSLEDTYVAEIEAVLRDEVAALIRGGATEEEAFRQASAGMGEPAAIGEEFQKVRRAGRDRFMPALVTNYLKVVGRRLTRQKAYSFITIVGLTVGMAAFLLIALYCRFERSYDGFHRNADRIFRVQNDQIRTGRHDRSAACPPGLGPAMKKDFAEVADFARLHNVSGNFNIVSRPAGARGVGEAGALKRAISFYEKRIFFADPSFLRIFPFPLIRGDARTALQEPNAAVLSESTARKYFGDEDPIGQDLAVTTRFGPSVCLVTGVCRDVPPNSHLRFDLLLSFSGLEALWPSLKDQTWASNGFLTYILLSPSADPRSLEAKFPSLIGAYPLETASSKREFHLQPLRKIHLTSRLRWEADVNGELKTVRLLETIGLFILIIAWVNFINLATARSLQRGKEVCVRKTLGAEKRQLTRQFLFESVVLNTLAFFLALAVVLTVLPAFSRLVGKPLSTAALGPGWLLAGLSILAGALLSGAYPAFILSSFRPVYVLKGTGGRTSRGAALRKGLVVFQFALAVLLIASTLTVRKQLAFIRNQDLGVDIGQTLVLRVPPLDDAERQALLARDRLAELGAVADAAVSASVPGRDYANQISGVRRRAASEDEAQAVFLIDVDDRYFQFFKVPVQAGRTFSKEFGADEYSVVLNEEAVRLLGFESPEKALLQNIDGYFGDTVQVIGVVKDYHHKSLHDKIEPVIYGSLPYTHFGGMNYLSLRIRGSSAGPAIGAVGEKWKELFPGQPLDYSFLDDDFGGQYADDKLFGRVFGWASLLALSVSCLGLFGLASFSAERRTREIGIRKVFGASPRGITTMLTGEFLLWVALANLIAWPLTWFVMGQWLRRFAYRTTVGLETLGGAALLTLIIALATVSAKTLRSAAANPVDSIRYE